MAITWVTLSVGDGTRIPNGFWRVEADGTGWGDPLSLEVGLDVVACELAVHPPSSMRTPPRSSANTRRAHFIEDPF